MERNSNEDKEVDTSTVPKLEQTTKPTPMQTSDTEWIVAYYNYSKYNKIERGR